MHQAQFAGDFHGTVGAEIIDKDPDVNYLGQFVNRDAQSFLSVIGGHHDGNSFSVEHSEISGSAADLHSS